MLEIYGASVLKHAAKWRGIRSAWYRLGLHLCQTWIDDPRITHEEKLSELDFATAWINNVADLRKADLLLLYAEPEDALRGAVVEAGVMLGQSKPVLLVGDNVGFGSWQYHPAVHKTDTIYNASIILRSWLGVSDATAEETESPTDPRTREDPPRHTGEQPRLDTSSDEEARLSSGRH
jgi:hypothetical protein